MSVTIASRHSFEKTVYPEMITNGTFTGNSTSWDIGTGWTYGDNAMDFDGINNYAGLWQLDVNMVSSMATNTNYTLEFDVTNASTYLRINWVSSDQVVIYIADGTYANGSHSLDFTSPAYIGVGGIRARTYTSGSSGTIDNVSLKQR